MSEIIKELKNLLEEEAVLNSNNIYVRTLSKLLKIERDSIYGTRKGDRQLNLDKTIMDEMKKYMDSKK